MASIIALVLVLAVRPAHSAETAAPPKIIPGAVPMDRAPDGNTVIFEDENGLIVVDTGRHFEHQAAIIAYASQRKKPINAIVNTHWHLDHSGGNQELRVQYPNAKLYTSNAIFEALDGFLARELQRSRDLIADPARSEFEKAELRLGVAALEDRRDLIPDVPVVGDTKIAHLMLHVAPYAATAGDTWIHDPVSRTVVAGDLVVTPVPFFDTACAEGWQRALDTIAGEDFDRLIPGHGETLTKSEFTRYRAAFERLMRCAKSDAASAACADDWQKDAAPFLHDERERSYAARAIGYYVDNLLRAPGKQDELCGVKKQ